jgi:hypothetical protein
MTDNAQYEALRTTLEQDPDRDVTVHDGALAVRQTKFAYLAGDSLAVRLPASRADDLVKRGIAEFLKHDPTSTADWVKISDREDWSELAAEAHELASGHQPGNRS